MAGARQAERHPLTQRWLWAGAWLLPSHTIMLLQDPCVPGELGVGHRS